MKAKKDRAHDHSWAPSRRRSSEPDPDLAVSATGPVRSLHQSGYSAEPKRLRLPGVDPHAPSSAPQRFVSRTKPRSALRTSLADLGIPSAVSALCALPRVRTGEVARSLVGILFAVNLTSCAPAVQLFDCADDGVDEALAEACERDEVNCEIATRLDVFCRPDIDTFSRCGRSPADDIEACTVQLGTSPIPGYRARMFVLDGVSVAAAIDHESRHWPLWGDLETNACETHDPACGWIED